MKNKTIPTRPYQIMGRWALLAAVIALVVVMLGAWTRLTHSGLGCPDWPGCYGFLTVPQDPAHVAIAEARFPDSPVVAARGWPEMIHRYAAGTLGLIVFGLAIYAFRHRRWGVPVRLPLFIAVFILIQACFGMWTVTLKLWPQIVASHLLGGFTTLSLLVLLTLRLRRWRPAFRPHQIASLSRLRPWVIGALMLVILQIALGAWTAANYAAVSCPDLPGCQGQWWPEMDFRHGFDVAQSVGPNYLGGQLHASGRVAIHVSHRLGAIAVLAYLAILLPLLWRRAGTSGLRTGVLWVAGALTGQIILGLLNVALGLPVFIAVAHNAMGAGLLLTLVHLLWQMHGCRLAQPVVTLSLPRAIPILPEVKA